jgi:hypothetical protein
VTSAVQPDNASTSGDREAFYTPLATPDLPKPTTAFNPGTGQRTISASAFKRNKTSLNQSIDVDSPAGLAGSYGATTVASPIGENSAPIDDIYQASGPQGEVSQISQQEPMHGDLNGTNEYGLDSELPLAPALPTYIESFSHSPKPDLAHEGEVEGRDLR